METTARTVVDRPIEDVWAYVSDVENMEAWVEGVGDVRTGDEFELAAGSTFSSSYTYRGETFDVEYEVTTVEAPRRLDVRWTSGPFPFTGSIRLVEVADGTEVSNTIDAGSDGLATSFIFTAFGPVVRWMMRRQLAAELDRLGAAIGGNEERAATVGAEA